MELAGILPPSIREPGAPPWQLARGSGCWVLMGRYGWEELPDHSVVGAAEQQAGL